MEDTTPSGPSRRHVLQAGAVGAGAAITLGSPLAGHALAADSGDRPDRLTVEYVEQPLGLDVPRPRLAWLPPARSARQTAYQIQVTRYDDDRPVWDSGRVAFDATTHVEYAGPGRPGYRTVTIRPGVPTGLDRAAASLDTVRGRVESAWSRDGDRFDLRVHVPAGTAAEVWVPGRQVRAPAGARFLRDQDGHVVHEVGAGTPRDTAGEPRRGTRASRPRSTRRAGAASPST